MKSCFIKWLIVAPHEENKGYDLAIFRRIEKYLIEQGVTEVTANRINRVQMWKAAGFKSTTSDQNETGVNWTGSLEGRTPQFTSLPAGVEEAPIRIVPADDDPTINEHLFAWYRTDNGAAIAKVRLSISEVV